MLFTLLLFGEKAYLQISLERKYFSNSSYSCNVTCEFWKSNYWVACPYYTLDACKISRRSKLINQMFKFQVFCSIKLCTKNKCINRIINNIQFEQNLTYMSRTYGTYNSTIRFSKFTFNKKIWKEFDGFGDFGEKSYLLSIIWTGTCPTACELGPLWNILWGI